MKPGETGWAAWHGDTKEKNQRILGASRGKAKAFVVASENGNALAGEEVARLGVDSFLRRPSLRREAMETIGGFMNHTVMAWIRPYPDFSFDAAALFLLKDQVSWLISGTGAVLIYVDGQLYKSSAPKPYPVLGIAHSYEPEVMEPVSLPEKVEDKVALLLLSGSCPGQDSLEIIRESLFSAESPEAWLEKVMTQNLPGASALAVFLPPKKKIFSGQGR